ncbi:hypothetical protein [Pantoea stewartii]|uniref:hypothetical protein n=1 Tax=Pantoea stewartii TaxID=66269 RepID=UPI00053567C3|nr:hypothetical protein [Pantoea stewartii]
MRKLQKLITAEYTNHPSQSNLPTTAITRIASKCRKDEVADAHILIKQLKAELAIVPDWDGDTQDDIWKAIELFRSILSKIRE